MDLIAIGFLIGCFFCVIAERIAPLPVYSHRYRTCIPPIG